MSRKPLCVQSIPSARPRCILCAPVEWPVQHTARWITIASVYLSAQCAFRPAGPATNCAGVGRHYRAPQPIHLSSCVFSLSNCRSVSRERGTEGNMNRVESVYFRACISVRVREAAMVRCLGMRSSPRRSRSPRVVTARDRTRVVAVKFQLRLHCTPSPMRRGRERRSARTGRKRTADNRMAPTRAHESGSSRQS